VRRLSSFLIRAIEVIRRRRRRQTFDPLTHGVFELGRDLIVPIGQSVYDPAVFGRYDLATQRVVQRKAADDGFWSIGFDEWLYDAQREARAQPDAVVHDRYALAVGVLGPGSGTCLDACTGTPNEVIRGHVERLGFDYLPIDIESDDERVRTEDVTALSFPAQSIARILSLDTLEHVENYQAALSEFHRVLEPGGLLVVHVPAYFFDRPRSAPVEPERDPWGHVRYFSGRELVQEIAATGLVLMRVQLHLDYGAILCVAAKSGAA
jgi:SAM-dependent methyltransferase